ncbi:hypothetical protein WICPIJ_006049 [Wickerhamomyces pijperi]|uniref:Pre-mRNA-splicing factor CWC26 n=1 Tax=Wickerhamomyces pijperi TaxID=599730 RepID=A0A9P8Q511_WICPI|nr:hypothetical protein WICPIJ_006049 [Wickerhamomyces pijperi]
MSLADYLNKNYVKDKSKKSSSKKRTTNESNVTIHDTTPVIKKAKIINNEQTQISTEAATMASQKPKQSAGWKVIGTNETITPMTEPTITMESGAKAGLQTSKEVSLQIQAKRDKELRYLQQTDSDSIGRNAETIHRDKSGSKVNIHDKLRNDQRRTNHAELEKQRKIKDMNMGLIQKLQKENKPMTDSPPQMTTSKNDITYNKILQTKQSQDDPLQSFTPSSSSSLPNVSLTGRKQYTKSFPENRFAIKPGYRWDGVDRSNGFEKKWFNKQRDIHTNEVLNHTMQEDY